MEEGITHFQNIFPSDINNITTSYIEVTENEQNNSNNVKIDMHQKLTTSNNIVDTNTNDCVTVISPASTIPKSNITSNISTLPSVHAKSCLVESSSNAMTVSNLAHRDEMIYSPMNIEVSFLSCFSHTDGA